MILADFLINLAFLLLVALEVPWSHKAILPKMVQLLSNCDFLIQFDPKKYKLKEICFSNLFL